MLRSKSIIVFLLLGTIAFGKDYKVSNIEEFEDTVPLLQPGDNVILANGEWRDVNLVFSGQGEANACIRLEAETAGKVVITGNSSLELSGKFLEVEGLWFKDGYTSKKSVISFRSNGNKYANNSRVTNCAITNYNPKEKNSQYFYLELWGKNNRIDHTNFSGKTNKGPTVVIWLRSEEHRENFHRIDHNYFGERPPLGENGGETIRIGTSHNSMYDSETTVENNVFEKCDGEAEIISNKSNNNKFRNNLFVESQGSLTLRHGNNALVEGNVFLGMKKSSTGGVRIINQGHVVRNNLFVGLRGEDLKSPLVMMYGVPNSPLNRYHQVKNADVQFNTFIDCAPLELAAGKNEERTLPPIESVMANNLFLGRNGETLIRDLEMISGIEFRKNIVSANLGPKISGFKEINIETREVKGIPIPVNAEGLKAEVITANNPKKDVTGNFRERFYIGAFNPGNFSLPKAMKNEAGTHWKKEQRVEQLN